ncbi:flagellar basal-body MS-ring/collar protein FliF [Quadrisphaera sp. DSM 44207]|uniref:flagellar basal-body MS-ring/collar protein FliF n=1 Tax=Quadrisphaera sp. DSM 44207 TaxID=1881057 RepID=UPI000882115E|nr:flagellar basal-body MS-ring/collar protein FliF [Quadrisphaera sp. DSM 44207]SDQ20129.1 flagellar M-ring protein FliF [Quadrisphaera sp. DSM 44207]
MQRAIRGRLQEAGRGLSAFTPAQRVIAVLGVALLVLGGVAFTRWATAPTYAPLFHNLAGEDAAAITEQLDAEGVLYELEDGGSTILVPREEVNDQRLKASAAGLPAASDTGYALLDEQGVTASQFQQQVTYQRALEGELATTVQSIDGVRTAVVHLAIPEESVFLDEAAAPTASVLVDTAGGRDLSVDQVQSIVHLVASSVDGMEPDGVTVVGADGALLSAAGESAAGVGGGVRDQQTTEYEKRTEAAVQAMLEKVLGPGKAVATVTADLDYDQTQRTTETFTSEDGVPPLSESSTTESYVGDGAGVGGALGDNGVLGMDATELAEVDAEGGSGYTKESVTRNNAVNKVTEQTTAAPGSVRRQSVAVVVDAQAAAGTGIAQLTDMVNAAAGVDAARGDVVSVTQAPFDTTAADQAAADLAAAAAAEAAERTQRLIAYGAGGLLLLIVLAVVLLLARRAAKKRKREVIDLGELDVLYDPAPAPEAIEGPRAPMLTPAGPDDIALRREEFAELVDQQPAEVADLLRGWLAEKK